MPVSADDVLEVLDRSAEARALPMLDNGYVYPAAARLSLFRSNDDWAMTFELFGYSPRAGWPDLCVTTIGSEVRHNRSAADFVSGEAYRRYLAAKPNWTNDYVRPLDQANWLDPEDEEAISPSATRYRLRGCDYQMPTATDLAAAGVVPERPPSVRVYELIRAVAHRHHDLVLATEQERTLGLPAPMPRLLTLDDWHHPDLAASALPSDEAGFRALAVVLETGDPRQYEPVRTGNAHWSNWPDGGLL